LKIIFIPNHRILQKCVFVIVSILEMHSKFLLGNEIFNKLVLKNSNFNGFVSDTSRTLELQSLVSSIFRFVLK
jgi:hypothetical protein